ncbi:MAG: glycosyltransferase family 4 protein, partial [Chloroflexota bacterium]
ENRDRVQTHSAHRLNHKRKAETALAPLGLNVLGYLRDETGVGQVARAILKSLDEQGIPVTQTAVKGNTTWGGDNSVLRLPTGNPHSINLIKINADQLPRVYQDVGPHFFQDKYNIGFWSWELSTFPEMWHDRFQYLDEIWVNSSFVQASIAAVSPIPVINMRVPVVPRAPSQLTRADLDLPTNKKIFLFVFDAASYIERKNPFGLINAYRKAFEPHFEDTLLVIKVNNLQKNPDVAQRLQKEIKQVSGLLINRRLPEDQLNGLFHNCDAYVSLHRAEGFGFTLPEAMLLGKPVIGTAYSGTTDYMTSANSYLVPYELIEIDQDYGPYHKGNIWAEPNITTAAHLMQQVVEAPEEAQQRGALARQDILDNYSPAVVVEQIIKRLRTIQRWGA